MEIHATDFAACRMRVMAVDFISDEQAARLGRFPDEISAEDLERLCWLDDADLAVVDSPGGCTTFWDLLSG
jgi:hypothetical protein